MASLAVAAEHFPFGVALFDEAGTLRAANPEAARLLGDDLLTEHDPPPTCCDLLQCGVANGPLHGRCLTVLAREAGERLPEIRLDIGPDEVTALWVSASPARGGVSVSLRPGSRADRRRRTEPHWMTGPSLCINAFGSVGVASGEATLTGSWLEHRTGLLLKFLVTQRKQTMHAEQIVAALWPTAGQEALNTLRQCVHALRTKLEPERSRNSPSSFILSRNGGYQLDLRRMWIDADEFERRVTAGLAAQAQDDAPEALCELEAALQLYKGDFLGDEPYAEWAYTERDRLRDLAGQALRSTSEIYLASGEMDAAAGHLQRLAQVDPYDIDIQRQLIGLYLRVGRRSQAVRRYERLRRQMLSAFGEELNFELSDLSNGS